MKPISHYILSSFLKIDRPIQETKFDGNACFLQMNTNIFPGLIYDMLVIIKEISKHEDKHV